MQPSIFPSNTAAPTFFRTYSNLNLETKEKESVSDVFQRAMTGLQELSNYTVEEYNLIEEYVYNLKTFFSGRWLWVGGKAFVTKQKNFSSAYNCIGMATDSIYDFGRAFNLLMQGCGVGASITLEELSKLPIIKNKINLLDITRQEEIGSAPIAGDTTEFSTDGDIITMYVGDSREAWVSAYDKILFYATDTGSGNINLKIDLKQPRKAGTPIKGFGGFANPTDLRQLFVETIQMLNSYISRKWDSFLAAWLYGRVAKCTVAGNIRRSAELMQGSPDDPIFTDMKDNLWSQDSDGKWRINPILDPLRMANHTRMFHYKPTEAEILESVTKQFYSGEGAIGYAPMAVIRCNVDLLDTQEKQNTFHDLYLVNKESAKTYLSCLDSSLTPEELDHRIAREKANPCFEILGQNFHCDLSEIHLNQLAPFNIKEQEEAFKVGGLIVAGFLKHEFLDEKFRYSRQIDPIVGVSITGLFDFFVTRFGIDWLLWWKAGRLNNWGNISSDEAENFEFFTCKSEYYRTQEKAYLNMWRDTATQSVWEYCDAHGLRRPNRCTTVQPAGTKSLLTGASCGYHPPKAIRYIRRITFGKNDPIALACMDYGYTIVPAQKDTDSEGRLLDDPFDSRCTEWLVEIPVEVKWAALADGYDIDPNLFSAEAQFDWFMQVQTHYSTHNTSSTIELRKDEIEGLAAKIYDAIQENKPYVSTALLSRFDGYESFPRLPFEPVSQEQYDALVKGVTDRRKSEDFYSLMSQYQTTVEFESDRGSVACESDKCVISKK